MYVCVSTDQKCIFTKLNQVCIPTNQKFMWPNKVYIYVLRALLSNWWMIYFYDMLLFKMKSVSIVWLYDSIAFNFAFLVACCGTFEKLDIDCKCLQGFTGVHIFFLQYRRKRAVRNTGRPHMLYVIHVVEKPGPVIFTICKEISMITTYMTFLQSENDSKLQ